MSDEEWETQVGSPDVTGVVLFLACILLALLWLGPLGRVVRGARVDRSERPLVEDFLVARAASDASARGGPHRAAEGAPRDGGADDVDNDGGARVSREGSRHRGAGAGEEVPSTMGDHHHAHHHSVDADSGEGSVAGDNEDEIICPICMDVATEAVETNCRHVFCADCLQGYWEHSFAPRACRCPVCRRDIDVIVPHIVSNEPPPPAPTPSFLSSVWPFSSSSPATSPPPARPHGPAATFAARYTAHIGRGSSPVNVLRDAPWYLRRFFSELSVQQMALCGAWGGLLLIPILSVIGYTVTPVDILPEATLGYLGYIDDFAAAIVGLAFIAAVSRNYSIARAEAIANGDE